MDGDATAFVPGHVTGFFGVVRADDPAKTGSFGAGLALTDGVTVTVEPADESTVRLDGTERSIDPVDRVLNSLGVRATVACRTPLPLGSGFGVSGAAALGTALAANTAFDCERSENDLIRLAHVAEVEAGTGLGDVVAQARGGVPIRIEPGAPPHGRLDGVPRTTRVEYLALDELSTADVIDGDTTALTAAGRRALDRLRERPTLDTFVDASREFAAAASLLTDDVRDVLGAVDDAAGRASMAMLGESVFALGTGLSDAGYDPAVCAVHPAGATLRFGDVRPGETGGGDTDVAR